MLNIKLTLIIILSLITTSAIAGTLLLMNVGLNGSGIAPACSNSLDFTDACNSQYITVI